VGGLWTERASKVEMQTVLAELRAAQESRGAMEKELEQLRAAQRGGV
jgi:hypothetical protein